MTPNPRPISLRPPPELLADIDAAVPSSPQANRSAWIIEACRQRLAIEAAIRAHGGPVLTVADDIASHEVLRAARESNPDARFLLVSGHGASIVDALGAAGHPVEFLGKPFKPGDLVRKVQGLLGGE